MEVSNFEDFNVYKKRFVCAKTKNRYLAYFFSKNEEDIDYTKTNFWKYARPIQKVKEYTIEELENILGHKFKIKE